MTDVATNEYMRSVIEASLYTRYVQRTPNEPAVSPMFIGEVGSGKTTLLKRYYGNRNVIWLTDFTSKSLITEVLARRKLSTVIVPDFARLLYRKKSTAQNLVSTLLSAVEDGYKSDLNEKLIFRKPRYLQLLTATTPQFLDWMIQEYEMFGLLDRFILVDVCYTPEERVLIENDVRYGIPMDVSPIRLFFPKTPIPITLPRDQCDKIKSESLRNIRNIRVLLLGDQLNRCCKIAQKSTNFQQNRAILLSHTQINRLKKGLKPENTSVLDRLLETPIPPHRGSAANYGLSKIDEEKYKSIS